MYRCVSFVKKPTLWCGFLFFTVAILWKHFRGEQFLQHAAQGTDTVTADAVMHPLSFFSAGHNACIAEDLHVVGQSGLADVQVLQKVAGTQFPTPEQLQNPDTVFVAQRLENDCHVLFVHTYSHTSH